MLTVHWQICHHISYTSSFQNVSNPNQAVPDIHQKLKAVSIWVLDTRQYTVCTCVYVCMFVFVLVFCSTAAALVVWLPLLSLLSSIFICLITVNLHPLTYVRTPVLQDMWAFVDTSLDFHGRADRRTDGRSIVRYLCHVKSPGCEAVIVL